METLALLTAIETKIKKLQSRNERLEKDNEELKKTMFEYLQKLELQKKNVDQTKHELMALQLSKTTNMDTAHLKKSSTTISI
ncbi:MAG: hypothetical protein IPN14_05790 [Bacteroidetes bacterium]|nr:hypothetical protein [Bacteroidota bacterium]